MSLTSIALLLNFVDNYTSLALSQCNPWNKCIMIYLWMTSFQKWIHVIIVYQIFGLDYCMMIMDNVIFSMEYGYMDDMDISIHEHYPLLRASRPILVMWFLSQDQRIIRHGIKMVQGQERHAEMKGITLLTF